MGKMKEIYEMVQDGTAALFIDAYRNARIHNELGFTYDYRLEGLKLMKNVSRMGNEGG